MTNPSISTKEGVCRRSLLKSIPAIAAAVISTNAMTGGCTQQTKATHEAAQYQDQPKGQQQCSGCVQFVSPASCKVVEDPISPAGWCNLFTAKTA
jgi:hypothetical protein